MTLKILFKNARFAAVELEDGGVYDMEKTWKIFVNGKLYKETSRVINMIYGLEPETAEKSVRLSLYMSEAIVSPHKTAVCLDTRIPYLPVRCLKL